MKSRLAWAFVLAAMASPANSAPATLEEAQRLATLLQSYLGNQPGLVSVTPVGDAYDLKLDAAPLFANLHDPKASASLTPLVMRLASLGGGKWQLDQDQPIAFAFKAEGTATMAMTIDSLKGTATFDEALGLFETATSDLRGLSLKEAITAEGQATTNVDYTVAGMHYEQAMHPDGPDAASGTVKLATTGIVEKFAVPANPTAGTPAMDFVLTSPSSTSDMTITGLKARPLMDLLAFLVAHPAPDLLARDQAALQDAIRAALPLFSALDMTGSADATTLQTMLGEFTIARAGFEANLTGIVKDGRFRERLSLDGVAAPPGLVPPWAADLVPHTLAFDFSLAGFDLEAPTALFLDKADFTRDPPVPAGMDKEFTRLLVPSGMMTLAIGPSALANNIATLTLQASMSVDPQAAAGAMPAFTSQIGLTGFDALQAALQKVPPEFDAQQALPAMLLVRGMARTEADGSLSWKIESGPGGAVLVNGTDVTKLGGGQ